MMKYAGIDVIRKKRCYVCVTNETCSVLNELFFQNNSYGIKELIQKIRSAFDNNQCSVVLESTANMWIRAYHAPEEHGIAVKIANPNKTKAIASATIKTHNDDEPFNNSATKRAFHFILSFTLYSQEVGIQQAYA